MLLLFIFLHYNYGCLNRGILEFVLFKFFLFLKELENPSFLFLLKFLLFLFLAHICLEVIKLFLRCSLTFLIFKYWLRYRLDRGITNGDKHRLLNYFIGLALFFFIVSLQYFFSELLLIFRNTNFILDHLLLRLKHVLSLFIASRFV